MQVNGSMSSSSKLWYAHILSFTRVTTHKYIFFLERFSEDSSKLKKYEKLVPELVAIISLALLIGEKDYNKRVCLVIYE